MLVWGSDFGFRIKTSIIGNRLTHDFRVSIALAWSAPSLALAANALLGPMVMPKRLTAAGSSGATCSISLQASSCFWTSKSRPSTMWSFSAWTSFGDDMLPRPLMSIFRNCKNLSFVMSPTSEWHELLLTSICKLAFLILMSMNFEVVATRMSCRVWPSCLRTGCVATELAWVSSSTTIRSAPLESSLPWLSRSLSGPGSSGYATPSTSIMLPPMYRYLQSSVMMRSSLAKCAVMRSQNSGWAAPLFVTTKLLVSVITEL
mmetsp:Transcript_1915/g.2395  ORF Transcript_1915/g.2395 Transcript_1915/m.2395 type:complete len:260 (-) Transcript_1915:565-1344(-)